MKLNSRQIGYIGCLVGACGWLIGLTSVCVGTGEWQVLRLVFLPGLALSLAMGLAIIVIHAALVRLVGAGHYLAYTSIGGMVLLLSGALLLLMNHWVAPAIDQNEKMRSALAGWAIYRTADVTPTVGLAAAAFLLGLTAVALLRAPVQRESLGPRAGRSMPGAPDGGDKAK